MKHCLSDDQMCEIRSLLLAGGCDSASVQMVAGKIAEIVEDQKPPRKLGRKTISNSQLADVLMNIENAQKRNPRLTSHSSLARALNVNRKKISRAMKSGEAAFIDWGRKKFHSFNPEKKFRPVHPNVKRLSPDAMRRMYRKIQNYLWN